eukprot:1139845-Pyramimonas_sp.AAC.1
MHHRQTFGVPPGGLRPLARRSNYYPVVALEGVAPPQAPLGEQAGGAGGPVVVLLQGAAVVDAARGGATGTAKRIGRPLRIFRG